MLVIAVSHGGFNGEQCDPYTCSAEMTDFKDDMDFVIDFICKERNIDRVELDEIFVIVNDNIFRHYIGEKIHAKLYLS